MLQWIREKLLKRAVAVAITAALAWAAAKWPGLPLPSPESLEQWIFAAIATLGASDLLRLGFTGIVLRLRAMLTKWASVRA